MDEKEFEEMIDKKFKYYLEPIMTYIRIQETIRDANLANLSKKQPRTSSGKKMPEQIGDYIISAKGCNRCGGKITWDLYDKDGGHNHPDHIDENGNIIDCPEFKKTY